MARKRAGLEPATVPSRISVLHLILVQRSEVRLLGGQQSNNLIQSLPLKGGYLIKGKCDGIRAATPYNFTAPY